jgi:four helix bundle protein
MNKVDSFRDLEVYQPAFALQQEIFELTRSWPRNEDFALISQIRRSSRSVGSNLSEAWAKRRYPAHFLSKLTDADGEAQETAHWINTAFSCSYIDPKTHQDLTCKLVSIGKRLGSMINRHESFCF